jgi:hypothetical protein
MGHQDQIVRCVMSLIADHYEDLEMVFKDASRWEAESGTALDRLKVVETLTELIKEGYAEAYILSADQPKIERAEYSPEHAGNLWFYLTSKARRFSRSFRGDDR